LRSELLHNFTVNYSQFHKALMYMHQNKWQLQQTLIKKHLTELCLVSPGIQLPSLHKVATHDVHSLNTWHTFHDQFKPPTCVTIPKICFNRSLSLGRHSTTNRYIVSAATFLYFEYRSQHRLLEVFRGFLQSMILVWNRARPLSPYMTILNHTQYRVIESASILIHFIRLKYRLLKYHTESGFP
jgi:hypothetical protein